MSEDRACFERNLGALARYPGVLRALEGVAPYAAERLSAARTGDPVIEVPDGAGRARLLHSRYDPRAEARRQLPEISDPLSSYAFLGAGLGYGPLELVPQVGPANCILWLEPDARLFRTILGRVDLVPVLSRPHTLLLVGGKQEDFFRLLHDHTQLLFSSPLKLIVHPASQQLHPELFDAYRGAIHEFAREGAVRLRTAFYLARVSLQNQMENLGPYLASPGIAPLAGLLAGQPAILVSAGPSLQKNIDQLASAVGRITIIAVSTALRRLLAHGIVPDFTVLIDYHRVSRRYFEGVPAAGAPAMVCETKAAAAAVGAYPGVHLFYNDLFLNTFFEGLFGDKGSLPGGSTVAHAAFHLARHLGADPIVLVGQDLSYPGGLVHVPGTAVQTQVFPQTHRFYSLEMQELEYYLTERRRFQRVPAIPDGEVPTDDVFLTYLREFELLFEDFVGTVIDATEGGARKQHTEVLTLRAVLERHAGARRPDLAACLERARAEMCVGSLREQALHRLAERRDDLRALRRLYQRILRQLDRVIAKNEAGEPADAEVLKVHELQAQCRQHGTTYLLLCNLAQSDVWTRRRADRLLDISNEEGIPRQLEQARRDREFVQGLTNASDHLSACLANGRRSLQAQRVPAADPA